jgi:hypothetical protein
MRLLLLLFVVEDFLWQQVMVDVGEDDRLASGFFPISLSKPTLCDNKNAFFFCLALIKTNSIWLCYQSMLKLEIILLFFKKDEKQC